MDTPPEPSVKIWQPRSFVGLELERLDFVPSFDQRVYHTAVEINVLLRGEARVRYRADRWAGKVGEGAPLVFVQDMDEVSTVTATTPTPVRMRTLRLSPDLLRGLLASRPGHDAPGVAFPHLLTPDPAVNRHLARLALRVFDRFEAPGGRLERESALLDLLQATIRCLAERAPAGHRDHARHEHRAVALAKAYLRDRFADDTSLDDLAALAHLSKFHLLEVFRREVGISPHVFQTHLRLHEAKRLLAIGRPIAEVAGDVGFADQSHLNRQFKRHAHGAYCLTEECNPCEVVASRDILPRLPHNGRLRSARTALCQGTDAVAPHRLTPGRRSRNGVQGAGPFVRRSRTGGVGRSADHAHERGRSGDYRRTVPRGRPPLP